MSWEEYAVARREAWAQMTPEEMAREAWDAALCAAQQELTEKGQRREWGEIAEAISGLHSWI